jgi:hypothetical protein
VRCDGPDQVHRAHHDRRDRSRRRAGGQLPGAHGRQRARDGGALGAGRGHEIIDSTQTPHGTSATYPDWRGGGTGEGLGHGTFILYADSTTSALVASRWSATDPTLFDTTAHPLAVGGLQ